MDPKERQGMHEFRWVLLALFLLSLLIRACSD